MKVFICVVCCYLLITSVGWCGSVQLPATVPDNIKKIAVKNWNKVIKTCPGISKYSSDLKVFTVAKQQTTDGEMISFEVLMPDRRSSIPPQYKSIGQHCYIDTSINGRLLFISKRSCMSVIMDNNYMSSSPPSDPLIVMLKP